MATVSDCLMWYNKAATGKNIAIPGSNLEVLSCNTDDVPVPPSTASYPNFSEPPALAYDLLHYAARPTGDYSHPSPSSGGYDLAGDARPSSAPPHPDRGADQFIDSDNDGLPDWFEFLAINYSTSDSYQTLNQGSGNTDADGGGR